MVDPVTMCSRHLLGEYHELFMFIGTLKKKKKIDGYVENNLIEPLALQSRFDVLKKEMLRRGFKPKAIFSFSEGLLDYLPNAQRICKIDRDKSLRDLLQRCSKCRKRYLEAA